MVCPRVGGSGGKGLRSKMGEDRKCLSLWRREQRVKPEFENQAKNQPGAFMEKRSCPTLSSHQSASYSRIRKAWVAHKTTCLLPVVDPLVLSRGVTPTSLSPKGQVPTSQREGKEGNLRLLGQALKGHLVPFHPCTNWEIEAWNGRDIYPRLHLTREGLNPGSHLSVTIYNPP